MTDPDRIPQIPLTAGDVSTLARNCAGRRPEIDEKLARFARAASGGQPVPLWIVSDTHQDWRDNGWEPWKALPSRSPEIVVVAGDAHAPGTAAIEWLERAFAGFIVIYVPGNHDFWKMSDDDRYTYLDMVERMRAMSGRANVHVLVDDQLTLAGIRFVGGTLWTDMGLDTNSRAEAYATARRGMLDFRRIRRKPSGDHRHLRPEETHAMHRATVAFLDAAMAVPHAGPTVVVTHHAPSPLSLSDPFMDLRHCYASDLEWLMRRHEPDLWVHGHLHTHSDYRVGRTRVVANPRGHHEELGTSGFIENMVVDV